MTSPPVHHHRHHSRSQSPPQPIYQNIVFEDDNHSRNDNIHDDEECLALPSSRHFPHHPYIDDILPSRPPHHYLSPRIKHHRRHFTIATPTTSTNATISAANTSTTNITSLLHQQQFLAKSLSKLHYDVLQRSSRSLTSSPLPTHKQQKQHHQQLQQQLFYRQSSVPLSPLSRRHRQPSAENSDHPHHTNNPPPLPHPPCRCVLGNSCNHLPNGNGHCILDTSCSSRAGYCNDCSNNESYNGSSDDTLCNDSTNNTNHPVSNCGKSSVLPRYSDTSHCHCGDTKTCCQQHNHSSPPRYPYYDEDEKPSLGEDTASSSDHSASPFNNYRLSCRGDTRVIFIH